jgi:hypothetical protein
MLTSLGIMDRRAQTVARLVGNDINMCTAPAVGCLNRKLSEAEESDTHFDNAVDHDQQGEESFAPAASCATESDSDSEFSPGGRWHECGELPAGDSHPLERQLHVMLGGESADERSREEEEDSEMQDDERDAGVRADGMRHDNNEAAEARIETDDQEETMLDLLQLCQDAGTSLQFFDKLVSTLRRHGKKGFDIRRASKRQTFLDNLRKKISCPRPAIIQQVGPHQVPKFDMLEQIVDLLKSVIFDDAGNLCINLDAEERFSAHQATPADCFVEVHGSKWHRTTDQQFVKDHDLGFLLPLIFCIDKTGTDAFQRHPLEPLMFTLALICRHMREKAGAWRHAGFVPKVSDYDTSVEGLQMCHDCLSAILADLKELQENPPHRRAQSWRHEEKS